MAKESGIVHKMTPIGSLVIMDICNIEDRCHYEIHVSHQPTGWHIVIFKFNSKNSISDAKSHICGRYLSDVEQEKFKEEVRFAQNLIYKHYHEMKKRKMKVYYYRDESSEFCPNCDGRTNAISGYDESPGLKYEIRECSECKFKFKLILSE